MKNITDFYGNYITVGDTIQLVENHYIVGKCVKADTEIIQVAGHNNIYNLYCKNVITIKRS